MIKIKSHSKYVVVTRPIAEDDTFTKQLRKRGINVFFSPSITITGNTSDPVIQKQLKHIEDFDWIVFTSSNGVRFFREAFLAMRYDKAVLQKRKIAAVGSQTAKEAEKNKLQVSFIPSRFTTEDLAREMPDVKGKRILLPRSSIANPLLQKQLEEKGAIVVNIPIYKTAYITEEQSRLEKLIQNNKILCITFTSPSTVKGFIESIQSQTLRKKMLSIPVFSIGPVTTKAAKEYGFQSITTADIFTTEGMLQKFAKSIL